MANILRTLRGCRPACAAPLLAALLSSAAVAAAGCARAALAAEAEAARSFDAGRMLDLPGSGTDAAAIDYAGLPRIAGEHAIVNPPDLGNPFQLHSYLQYYRGLYWCMWSQGPGEDQAGSQVRYATSRDGLHWSPARMLAAAGADGYGWIARGFWLRHGQLLALAAHFRAPGAFGVNKDLSLQAFSWDAGTRAWRPAGLVEQDAISNFPPEQLPDGAWMMAVRNARISNAMLIGGEPDIGSWRRVPVSPYVAPANFRPDEPVWWRLAGGLLVALFRDNGGSRRLFRAVSADGGSTWSTPVRTNFPDSGAKFCTLLTSAGYRVLISNANPGAGRRELWLSLSEDGAVIRRMALLAIPQERPATLQYPHALERSGQLLIAFSRNKRQIEVLRVPIKAVDALRASGS